MRRKLPAAAADAVWKKSIINRPACSFDDGETTALFDPLSGETHFLSALPVILLDHLPDHPIPFSQLVSALADHTASDLDEDAITAIGSTLAFLEAAELVESQDPEAK